MSRFIITLTDRSYVSQLDLRKDKLSSLRYISFFKFDEQGSPIAKEFTSTYFSTSSNLSTVVRTLKDNMSKNLPHCQGYVEKDKIQSFIKFAKKHGKVVETDSIDDSFLSVLNSFNEEESSITSQIKELEKTFKIVNYLDSKGCYKKIDYKNIIVKTKSNPYSQDVTYISDDKTYITHMVVGTFTSDMKLEETSITFYSYYSLGRSESFTILKANKKGRVQYLDLAKQLCDLNQRRTETVHQYLKTFFN